MTKEQTKKLFHMFQSKTDDFDFYNDLIVFLAEVERDAVGYNSAIYYEVLTKLTNSINNAGHEERRHADISFISSEMSKIAEKYNHYLG